MTESESIAIARQAQMLANRVKKRFDQLRRPFARQSIEVFRLYDWDIPEIRAVVDWYAGHLVVGEYMRRQSTAAWLPAMGQAVAAALDVPMENVHLKQRIAGKPEGGRYARLNVSDKMIQVGERDLRFWVNLDDWVDTGLFADHRDTRQLIRQIAAGKDFLNLYGYTGTFCCYAAKGGARSTVSVDRSKTATRWARQNLALNGIDATTNSAVELDAFAFLKTLARKPQRFDLALVDPPSYSTTAASGDQFNVVTDHPLLLAAVLEVMRPGATVFFSTNHQDFTLCAQDLDVAGIEEITAATIPEDFARKRRPPIHRCWQIDVRAEE